MKKIMVIDDEPSVRAAVRISLSTQPYTVLEAASGEEGLNLAKAELPDLVLSDVTMAGMDGFAVLQGLRSRAETSSIPVILMTGRPDKADARFSMEQGADDYLSKPFSAKTLITAVQVRLERRQVIQEQAKANEVRLLEILSVTRDLIALADPAGTQLLYLNPAGRKMLGVGLDENISKLKLADFIRDSETTLGLKEQLACVDRYGIWVGEGTVTSRDGRRIPVSKEILLHLPSDARASFLSILARDISERKRAEAELEKTNLELVSASRLAGMAEVSTGVLHNVGNVISSINVASNCVNRSVKEFKIGDLAKAAALLGEHEADLGEFLSKDAKGKQIPAFLAQLSELLLRQQKAALEEIAELQQRVDHLKDVVTIQQNYAKILGKAETSKVADLVEDSLRMSVSTAGHHGIRINKEYDEDQAIMASKSTVLQILVNLICNARQSCEASGRDEKSLTIRATNGGDRVRISVSDNGVGIPAENLERIFMYGFTTKQDGHGFGLHAAAQAAREMGGVLLVESEGTGKGATFTLELPVRQAVPTI